MNYGVTLASHIVISESATNFQESQGLHVYSGIASVRDILKIPFARLLHLTLYSVSSANGLCKRFVARQHIYVVPNIPPECVL